MPQNGHVNGQLPVPIYTENVYFYLYLCAWLKGPTPRMSNIAHTPQYPVLRIRFICYLF